jgi:hypothetical protein
MTNFYSLGILRAKPGKEEELLVIWQALCDGPTSPLVGLAPAAAPKWCRSVSWKSTHRVVKASATTATAAYVAASVTVASR